MFDLKTYLACIGKKGKHKKGAGALLCAAAAIGVTLAVIISFAAVSLCAAMISGSDAGEDSAAAFFITGASGADQGTDPNYTGNYDMSGDGYVAAMATLSSSGTEAPTTGEIAGAILTSSPVGESSDTDAGSHIPQLSPSAGGYFPEISVSAECAVLLCADTGELFYEKNADTRHAMASTTKIMTALVTLEQCELTDPVLVSSDAVGIIGSSVYLYPGERMTMESLLYALMLESANDAAAAIAIAVGGDIEGFADMMNDRASSLGLKDTHFDNPHGLDSENHYTTARELSLIAAEAMKNDIFRSIVSTYKKSIPMHDGQGTRLLINHNKLLKGYDGAIGIKTGYTSNSGRCLVSAAERNGMTLIAVTLNAPDDWNDHRAMLDAGFEYYERVSLAETGSEIYEIPVIGGEGEVTVHAENEDSASVVLPTEHGELQKVIELPQFLFAPVSKGEQLGRTVWYYGGQELASVPLYASGDVTEAVPKLSLWDKILEFLGL